MAIDQNSAATPLASALGRRTRIEVGLWLAQRLTAMALAVAVLIHLATILYAVRQGLSAAAILERTRGNMAWLVFYGGFATIAAVHGTIGLRTVLREMTGIAGPLADAVLVLFGALLALLGWRAAFGLFG